jgi:hypothetical protein
MKKNMSKLLIIVVTIISISVFSSSCYDDNGDAVVTIHLERNDLVAMGISPKHELSIIDKILNFFSTRAEAAPTWNASKSDLTLTITSDSFEDMQFTIPSTATEYKVTVAPGSNATFTITSETDWDGGSINIQKNWGGHTTFFLIPGSQEITIQMLPMTFITSVSVSTDIWIYWATGGIHSSVQSYKVYRSTSINDKYSFIGSSLTGTFNHANPGGITYFYKVSTVCDLGDSILREGVLSDPETW